jgi:hypothetical protein
MEIKQELLIPIIFFIVFFTLNRIFEWKYTNSFEKILALFSIIYYTLIDLKYGVSFGFIFMIYLIHSNNNIERFNNETDYVKMKENAVIPLNIYQTWHTKNLPTKMQENVNCLKRQNPEFKYYLYDDYDCREFIKKNFDKDVLNAFDTLIPGAYKADLWRYCILYKNGGIYLDIKFKCENNFKLIELTDKEYVVLDRPYSNQNMSIKDNIDLVNDTNFYKNIYKMIDTYFWKNKEIGLYNALIVSKPNNPILLECINSIVENVKNRKYQYNPLYITGPGLFGEKFFKGDYGKIEDIYLFNSLRGNYILSHDKIILSHYPDYRDEQKKHQKNEYYHYLWSKKQIYKD